jgi:hypothetical protein
VDNSTTAVLRGTDRTLTGTTGSLLLERLTTSTRNLTATLGLVGSLAGSSKLRHDDLVHEGDVGHHIKEVGGEIDGSRLLTGLVQDVNCGHG